ncbi:MAG: C1 family peptidase, partial [Eubacteriales bacterium]|nr:C1 family peptidase [Eubacteriales bacterium]
ILGFDLSMSKADMLDYRHSAMNHAMVLTGVNLKDDQPNRWKIENSWGDKNGQKGYYVADDAWFERYVYQAVIYKRYLTGEQLEALEQKPIELEPWDPMGTLAGEDLP